MAGVDGYRLVAGSPRLDEYLRLRAESGLSPKTAEQARGALAGSWTFCHVRDEASGEAVAMGRLIGDGGWYFHIADMATLPAHQRRGLANLVLTGLLDRIREAAPPGAYVTLMADEPGLALYRRFGFVDPSPRTRGMALRLDGPQDE